MPNNINPTVVTISLATLEACSPPYNLNTRTIEEGKTANVNLAFDLLAAAASHKPDLVLLPEVFFASGLDASQLPEASESIPGPTFDRLSTYARETQCYVLAGFLRRVDHDGEVTSNEAILLDRNGDHVGTYAKVHPVDVEIDKANVRPGRLSDCNGVFDTDFGRIGCCICFDINWPDQWQAMKDAGAEVICWLSAYDGGFPLRALAYQLRLPIVSSVQSYHSRFLEPTGHVAISTSRWSRLAVKRMCLKKKLFHTDGGGAEKMIEITKKYGSRCEIEAFTEEHIFTLETDEQKDSVSVNAIAQEFNLISLDEYLTYSHRCVVKALGGS